MYLKLLGGESALILSLNSLGVLNLIQAITLACKGTVKGDRCIVWG